MGHVVVKHSQIAFFWGGWGAFDGLQSNLQLSSALTKALFVLSQGIELKPQQASSGVAEFW
jgi:hypothetical protein